MEKRGQERVREAKNQAKRESWGGLKGLGGHLRDILGVLEGLGRGLGGSWEAFGRILGGLGELLGGFWEGLGRSWGSFEGVWGGLERG